MAVIGREAARAPLTSADINDGIITADDLIDTLDLSSKTLTLPSLATVDINGGTIDGVTIGGSSAGAITGTTGQFNTSLNVDGIMTSDDATITGRVTIQSTTSPELRIVDGNNVNSDFLIYSPDGTNSLNIKAGSLQTEALSISSTGNISFYEDTGTTAKFFWDASAEALGIGTTSPTFADGSGLEIERTSATSTIRLQRAGTSPSSMEIRSGANNGEINVTSNSPLLFATNNSEAMRITSSGNVGIGTQNPATGLDVRTTNYTYSGTTYDIYGVIGLTAGGVRLGGDSANSDSVIGTTGTGDMQFVTYNGAAWGSRMTLTNTGNVGIGSTDPGGNVAFNGEVKLETKVTTDTGYVSLGTGSGRLPSGTQIGTYNTFNSASSLSGIAMLNNGPGGASMGSYIGALAAPSGYGSVTVIGQTSGSNSYVERMRIDDDGNVGIGTSSPDTLMELRAANPVLTIRDTETSTASNDARLRLAETGVSDALGNYYDIGYIQGNLQFRYNTSEYMRLDASGNLLVGTTDTNPANNSDGSTGFAIKPTGELLIASDENVVCYMNRQGTDGDIAVFRKDGTTVGSIGVYVSDRLYISDNNDCGLQFDATLIRPCDSSGANNDNAIDLGSSGARFNDAYITNGVTTGSDGRDKQDIAELDEAERRVAVAAKSLLRKWRWKDAVAKKGDDARIHFGIIAQDLKAAFEAEGLDAGRYGMFMYDEWTDEETGEERSRMGVRYSELLAFIIAAL